jgi:hypothetical protein
MEASVNSVSIKNWGFWFAPIPFCGIRGEDWRNAPGSQEENRPELSIECRTDFFERPVLPNKCGVPPGLWNAAFMRQHRILSCAFEPRATEITELWQKFEIRNSKSETNSNWGRKGNEENGGGGLSTNFANFREFFGRGILTADDADFRGWGRGGAATKAEKTQKLEIRNPKQIQIRKVSNGRNKESGRVAEKNTGRKIKGRIYC